MINVSERAVVEMKRFIEEEADLETSVHVFVEGACGCGAARYGMALGKEIPERANILDLDGVRLVIDEESAPYLDGAEIDYQDTLMAHGFVVSNPNRPRTGCGCGG